MSHRTSHKRARSKREVVSLILLCCLLVCAIALFILPGVLRFFHLGGTRGHHRAEAINNAKQVKLALDLFSMDHDGMYPNAATAETYAISSSRTSNDLFKQLFAVEATMSERIFWIKGSQVCNPSSPDDITFDGKLDFCAPQTLKPGDNGWAYVRGQTNIDYPARPILFESPPTASGLTFDPDLWDGKVIVLRVDGSARAERLDPSNRLLDGDAKELLTPASEVWGSETTKVEIAYPQPAR